VSARSPGTPTAALLGASAPLRATTYVLPWALLVDSGSRLVFIFFSESSVRQNVNLSDLFLKNIGGSVSKSISDVTCDSDLTAAVNDFPFAYAWLRQYCRK
jgi:hypothetical protein